MLKKNGAFEWSEKAKRSFENLKEQLCSPSLLINTDLNISFSIQGGANQFGAVLSQKNENAEKVPLAYVSNKHDCSGKNYSSFEQEY